MPMWDKCETQCESDVRSVRDQCEISVRPMWDPCEINAKSNTKAMWNMCKTNGRATLNQCDINVRSVWNECETKVQCHTDVRSPLPQSPYHPQGGHIGIVSLLERKRRPDSWVWCFDCCVELLAFTMMGCGSKGKWVLVLLSILMPIAMFYLTLYV